MLDASLPPVRNRSLTDGVFESLRDAIFTGRMRPGDPVRELHLAKELGVSQATVREALGRLERYGLVVRIPNRETIVARHSQRDIRERIAVRTVLEEMAFNEAATRMTKEDFQTLTRKLQRLEAAAAANEYFATAQADLDFHRVIWRLSGNAALYETLDHLTTPLLAFVSVLRSNGAERLADVLAPHEKVIRALRSKKPAVIQKVAREHTTFGYDEFLNSEAESLEALLGKRPPVSR